ncbi:hypothetical protein EXS70_00385 [Candidatus Peribacteria bacterium]|nr:hypothetical protein [Candidatus Peribacteria bacterium]
MTEISPKIRPEQELAAEVRLLREINAKSREDHAKIAALLTKADALPLNDTRRNTAEALHAQYVAERKKISIEDLYKDPLAGIGLTNQCRNALEELLNSEGTVDGETQ